MTNDWLVGAVCRLAAELADEIEHAEADSVQVELRVKLIQSDDPGTPVVLVTEHVRRIQSLYGEWGGTDRFVRERFG